MKIQGSGSNSLYHPSSPDPRCDLVIKKLRDCNKPHHRCSPSERVITNIIPCKPTAKCPQPWAMAQLLCLRPQRFWDMTGFVRSAVEALRKTQGLPQQLRLFLPDLRSQNRSRIVPTASPYSAEGRRNRGHQRGNIPFPFPSYPCSCVYVCPLEQGQKRSSLFILEIWDRNPIPLQATANWLIVTSKDFIHSISRWGKCI